MVQNRAVKAQVFCPRHSPWKIAECSLQYKYKGNPLVITVEDMLLILAAKTMANAAVVQRGVVFGGAVLVDS